MNTLLYRDFSNIVPTDLEGRDIRLLGVDIENVLTDYGNPEVFPEARETFEELQTSARGLDLILITNNQNRAFIRDVQMQLGEPVVLSPLDGYSKKPAPDMFEAALRIAGVRADQAAHVDDQFKSSFGARTAGFGTFFWTRPKGEHQHRGVRAFRPVEFGLIRPAIVAANQMRGIH